MPMKYAWGMPLAVKIVGWIHGVLFMIFCVALVQTIRIAKWPWSRAIMVFVAALLPFGPFVVDKRVLSYEDEFRKGCADGKE
jgi:integral membrane protein